MISLLKSISRSRVTLGARRIGLDIGTRALKLVQVEQTKSTWRVINSLLLPYPCGAPATSADISQGFVRAVLEDVFSQSAWQTIKKAGCVFSMDLSRMHTVSLPAGTETEHRQMAESELAEAEDWNSAEQVFDLWCDAISSAKNTAEIPVHVLSIPRSAATALAYDLLPFGMQCDAIDGLPFAIARAVSLSLEEDDVPVAALDWGASAVLFVLCEQGRPVFIRRFRDCGSFRIVEQIEKRLGLAAPECARLLESLGIESSDHGLQNNVARIVAHATQTTLRVLLEEMSRTLRFLKADLGIAPERLVLLGGGSSIRHISRQITEWTGLDVENWAFPGQAEVAAQDAVFAAAYAAAVGGAP